ncbi:alpha-(1,3)-fucosyltransferase 7-like [Lytechinus variegatus]|uniref:alpha-(1,3)-fucosyltransferase 7-like n=1 Tax=Lytechinus variegatus TaxID=7654 RepID=UPI001BB22C12|nr:alpha-(1,3)-fucosyltransferase 7-like [Lytechinus variegatus]
MERKNGRLIIAFCLAALIIICLSVESSNSTWLLKSLFRLSEVHGSRSPMYGNASGHSEKRLSCYRRVQVWAGKSSTGTPKNIECPGLDCGLSYTFDRSYETMAKSDAIVFFHGSSWNWTEIQKRRPLNQAWVFYSLESPRYTSKHAAPPAKLDHLYNYTMSYRPTASIPSPYGLYNKTLPQISSGESRNWAKEKSALVAWMASNCGRTTWRRHDFVKTLAKHVSVDMYGRCGSMTCDRFSKECRNKIKNHKFYLSLESSECRDYITEKFWSNALLNDVVPIVYGPPRVDYERVAPPNSFIHLQDFKSFQELVDFIHLLDSNDALYNSYFEWKKHGSVKILGEAVVLYPPYMCKLVSKLLDDEDKLRKFHQEAVHPSVRNDILSSCFEATGFPHDF